MTERLLRKKPAAMRLAVCAAMVVLLALGSSVACGDDGDTEPAATVDRADVVVEDTAVPSTATATATVTPTVRSPEVVPATRVVEASPSPAAGGRDGDDRHIFIAPISNQLVPDPVFGDFGSSGELHYEIFAGLTEFGDDDAGAPVQLAMASMHDSSADGLEHSFQLRQGLRFSDGSEVTAADFKWTWERALRVAAGTDAATQAEWVLGNIVGAAEMLAGEAEELVGVSAVDERSLTVRLVRPGTDLLYLLAHPAAAVLQRANVEGWGHDWADYVAGRGEFRFGSNLLPPESLPVGTGPFRLTQYNDGFEHELMVVERNEHYFGEAPRLDEVRFDGTVWGRVFENPDGYYAGLIEMLRAGLIDVGTLTAPPAYAPGGVPWHSTARGQSRPQTVMLVVNPSIPPLDSVDFRRALMASVDVAEYGELFHDGLVPTGITAPGLPGYSDASRLIPYDVDAAQESFARYDADGGFNPAEVLWVYEDARYWDAEREHLIEGWRSVLPVDFKQRGAYFEEFQELRADNLVGLSLELLSPAYPHPSANLVDFRRIFGKGAVSEELEGVAELVEAARGHPDPIVQAEKFGELEQHLLEQALVLPLVAYPAHGLSIDVQPWVQGYTEPRYGGSRFKDVWFDDTYPGGR